MARGELAAARVIDGNRAQLAAVAVALVAVEQHDDGPAVAQRVQVADVARCGRDHDPLNSLLFEQSQVARLALRRAVGRADDDRAALLVHRVLEAADRLRRRRARSVEHDRAEAAAVATAHLMSSRAADEPELVDHLEHAGERVRARPDPAGSARSTPCRAIRLPARRPPGSSRAPAPAGGGRSSPATGRTAAAPAYRHCWASTLYSFWLKFQVVEGSSAPQTRQRIPRPCEIG